MNTNFFLHTINEVLWSANFAMVLGIAFVLYDKFINGEDYKRTI